ncbi:MAG: cytochrome [Hyphomicrobiales bacterium]|nr:cytochrome [Hyphomicrobiales bacterium]
MKALLSTTTLALLAGLSLASAETPVERGEYLVRGIMGCGDCHTPRTNPPGPYLSGGNKQFAGQANSANITPDVETGIGGWSDEQIIRAMRDGKRPDGSTIGPPMPVRDYRGVSDDDMKAVVAFLRTVPPVKNKVARSEYKNPLPDSYGPPVTHVAAPAAGDKVALGGYLAGPLGHCMECHSPLKDGKADLEGQLGAGGQTFRTPKGEFVSANLTPTGLSRYTDDDLKKIITTGLRPDGTKIAGPMEVELYAHMTASDLDAVVVYLRSLPPKG